MSKLCFVKNRDGNFDAYNSYGTHCGTVLGGNKPENVPCVHLDQGGFFRIYAADGTLEAIVDSVKQASSKVAMLYGMLNENAGKESTCTDPDDSEPARSDAGKEAKDQHAAPNSSDPCETSAVDRRPFVSWKTHFGTHEHARERLVYAPRSAAVTGYN